jgi:hypothetical protein
MSRMDKQTIEMLYGQHPLCECCGERPADLFWAGALEQRDVPDGAERSVAWCYHCGVSIVGGLLVDLLLGGIDEEAVLEHLRIRGENVTKLRTKAGTMVPRFGAKELTRVQEALRRTKRD